MANACHCSKCGSPCEPTDSSSDGAAICAACAAADGEGAGAPVDTAPTRAVHHDQTLDATPEALADSQLDFDLSVPVELPSVPGYEILERLGAGTVGVVYRARQEALNRIIALKIVALGSHGDSLGRLQTEAESLAQLQHPNIVQIFEVGQDGERLYFCFEYVDGGTLDGDLRPRSPRDAAALMETVARATHYAHESGILHRDLKPENVLLTAEGVPKIADFGLAKRFEGSDTQTRTGTIVGTPAYMSPEQAAGRSRDLGPTCDVYALGGVFYKLLTGQPPHTAESIVDALEKVRSQEPLPPTRLQPRLHRDLETICLKCLDKSPERRYATAEALADDLRRFLDGEPIEARLPGKLGRTTRWLKRNPVAGLAAALLLFGAAGLAVTSLYIRQLRENEALVARASVLPEIPLGLPQFSTPSHNPTTAGKVALGRQLFFDPRLSLDNKVSCASCHNPAKGWSDGRALAIGVTGVPLARSSPTIVNSVYHNFLFWDGRAGSLEEQALAPILNPHEMGLPSREAIVEKVSAVEGYRDQFQNVFGGPVTADRVASAIAAFERTILAGDAPYDRYRAGDNSAMSAAAARGMQLFFNEAHCSACHAGPHLTDGAFHNIGIGMDVEDPDMGRGDISGLEGDRGSFRTPSLRNVAATAPYMHDGSLATLEDVVAYYNRGGFTNPQLDEEIYALELTAAQQADLVTFLIEGLSSEVQADVEPPVLP